MDINSAVAASRLIAQQRALEVTAGNLANSNTPGFRAVRVQFSDWLSRQSNADVPPGGRTIAYTQDRATWRDHQPSSLTTTGNPLDLALTGDGYFTVDTPRGPRLTRDGRFTTTQDGRLTDTGGNAVLDSTGRPIQFGPTDTRISIAGDGTISSENGQLAKLGVVRPQDPMQMKGEGDTLYVAGSPTVPVNAPGVVQGAVEGSNVQPILEVTRLIHTQRQFEFVAQFIQAESDRHKDAIDKILTPAN
ncbi:MAG: flagellar hook basal-body protein [Acetobacteraceae bacterium]